VLGFACVTIADSLCAQGGMVVGMKAWLPGDPSERFVSRSEWIGCNRLVCADCRSWVRQLDCTCFGSSAATSDIEQLYFDVRAAMSRAFKPSTIARIYLCRCHWAECVSVKAAVELERANWKCVGHPAPRVINDRGLPPGGGAAEGRRGLIDRQRHQLGPAP